MDFFNSLSQVAKNRHNFKKWEDNQHNEDAQREELAKRRQHTAEEIQNAKKLGENIIDVVDIMDNHSENVAENVETAVDPLSSIATMTTFIGGNFLVGKYSTDDLQKKIFKIKDENRNSEEYRQLKKRVEEYWSKNQKDAPWDILSKRNIKRIKDTELKQDLMAMKKRISKETGKYTKQIFRNHGLVGLATLGVFVLSTIFEAKLQTDSSKIARYQARQALEDPREFVNYTPEQIAAAKKELEEHPELLKQKKQSKLKSGMIKSIYGILRDKRAYNADKAAREDNSQKVTRPLTKEELIQAEKDRDVIQRTVRIINNEAEKNSENMEVAANVIMNTTPILGATFGAATGWLLNKFYVLDKFVNNTIEKEGNSETQKLYKELKNSKKTGVAYSKQWFEFAESLWNNHPNTTTNTHNAQATVKKAKNSNFNKSLKKAFASGFAHKTGKQWILGAFGGIVTGFAGMMIGLKLQKSAARAGRYTAKRELEKNPENFIGYTQDDYNEVKDIKNEKKKPNKFKEYALFIPTVLKQYWDYNKYKNHEYKEKQALKDILKKQEISDVQLRDAKNLQRKLFNTFEKVDDNSQVYSESMEAATEIAQPFVIYGGALLAISPAIYTCVQMIRGKITPAKLLDKITTKLSNSSTIMKKKWFKKYLGNVEKNITTVVNNTEIPTQTVYINDKRVSVKMNPLAKILKDIDLQKDPITKILTKAIENGDISAEKFKNFTDEEQIAHLLIFKQSILNTVEKIPNYDTTKINNFFDVLINGSHANSTQRIKMNHAIRNDVIDLLINPNNIPTQERIDDAQKALTLALNKETAEAIVGYNMLLREAKELFSTKEFKTKLAELEAKIRESAKDTRGEVPLNRDMITFAKKFLGEEKFNECFGDVSRKGINIFMNQSNIPKGTIAKPDEISTIVGVQPDEAIKLLDEVSSKVKIATFKDAFELLPSKFTNPKEAIANFRKNIEKMSKEEFEDFADFKLNMSSMNKETLLGLLPKIEKILDNIPKEELDKITDKLIKEFNEHPDEVIRLISTGKITNIFITPELKKALAVAGISWTAFSVAITYAIEAWLADMQLKAGRLGVMKAMESLEDPTYYANIEPTVQEKQVQSKETNQISSSSNTNLLDKLKKN